jgi:hypothetical protein
MIQLRFFFFSSILYGRTIAKASKISDGCLTFMADRCSKSSTFCDLVRYLEGILCMFTDGRESRRLCLGFSLSAAARGDGAFDDDISPSFSYLDDFFSSNMLLDFFCFSFLDFRVEEYSSEEQACMEAVPAMMCMMLESIDAPSSTGLEETTKDKGEGRFEAGLVVRDSVIAAPDCSVCAGSCLGLGRNGLEETTRAKASWRDIRIWLGLERLSDDHCRAFGFIR